MLDFEELKQRALSCQDCALCETRTQVVFGEGSEKAKIVFVGEAPGAEEDKTGHPFVGRSGQLLGQLLSEIGLSRKDVYIANVVKCRPPQNRDPKPCEEEACKHYLFEQLKLLNPTLIVCLGRIAAKTLIDVNFQITSMHGQVYEKDGFHYMAVYHPAAILRQRSKMHEIQADFQTIKRYC